MSFFRHIQDLILASQLKKEMARTHRDKKFNSFVNSRSIGILYMVGEEKDQIEFTAFVTKLKEEKKEIKALGLLKYKDIPHYCYPKISYDYITTRNINWMKKPTGEKVHDFINKEFDILINFDTTRNASLNYIAGLSHAKCKVGLFHEINKPIYDLMIDVQAGCPFQELGQHYINYINMFSQKT